MLNRWDPFREMMTLRDAMNRLLEESFVAPTNRTVAETIYRLPVDVWETPDAFVVQAVVPGLSHEDIDIEYSDGSLVISGEIPFVEHENATYHLRERWYGKFQRVLTFPAPIDADKIEAELENGILTITLPKTEDVKPRRITVKSA